MEKMSIERKERFSELFEQLVSVMTAVPVDLPRLIDLLGELSDFFRISKGITYIYQNPADEKAGKGEMIKTHDLGLEDKLVASYRLVTSSMTVVKMEEYMTPDAEPWSDDEREKVDLVMRTAVTFISRNRLRDLVEQLAMFDDSGFRNQRSMTAYLSQFFGKGKMNGKAVLHYNMRHFVLVNQEIGRAAGDEVMKNHYLGVEKIINKHGCIFRLGGDNFVAVCAADRLDEIIGYLTETTVRYNGGRSAVNIICTAGVFVIPDDYLITGLSSIMENIILCQRAAQSGGKDHIVFYDDSILQIKEKSMRVQQLFPEALRNEEFKVFYQPKVNIETGEICGAEALCRWFRNGKIVPPIDFIPMLEETSDICRLDLYVLEHVCRDIRRWLDEGRRVVRVSVNLSRKHMMNADLLNTITKIIDRFGISHSYIEIELTETTTDVEFNDLKRVVSGLQSAGISTSVDDFGIGYSSLNLLREIPWNVLKVDKSFLPVDDRSPNSTNSVMFKYVIAMARELGLECIAEGVETRQQLSVLHENNCGLAQGFLFDRPLPVEDFEQRLEMRSYRIDSENG